MDKNEDNTERDVYDAYESFSIKPIKPADFLTGESFHLAKEVEPKDTKGDETFNDNTETKKRKIRDEKSNSPLPIFNGSSTPVNKKGKFDLKPLNPRTHATYEQFLHPFILTQHNTTDYEDFETDFKSFTTTNSSLFAGKEFLIMTTPTPFSGAKRVDEPPQNPPFCKQCLTYQISAGGGTIIKTPNDMDWENLANGKKSNAYFVTNSHTPISDTFLKAVVIGVPCVNQHWITACIRESSCIDHKPYLHSLGRSLTTGSIMKWHQCSRIFRGLLLAVKSLKKNTTEFEFWEDILEYGGGTVIPVEEVLKFAEMPNSVAVIVMIDHSYPTEDVRDLRRQGVVLLKSDWVIESIFVGQRINWKKYETLIWGRCVEV